MTHLLCTAYTPAADALFHPFQILMFPSQLPVRRAACGVRCTLRLNPVLVTSGCLACGGWGSHRERDAFRARPNKESL